MNRTRTSCNFPIHRFYSFFCVRIEQPKKFRFSWRAEKKNYGNRPEVIAVECSPPVGKEEIKTHDYNSRFKLQIIIGWLESFEQRKNNNGLEMKIDHWVHDLQWDFVRNSSHKSGIISASQFAVLAYAICQFRAIILMSRPDIHRQHWRQRFIVRRCDNKIMIEVDLENYRERETIKFDRYRSFIDSLW